MYLESRRNIKIMSEKKINVTVAEKQLNFNMEGYGIFSVISVLLILLLPALFLTILLNPNIINYLSNLLISLH